MTDSKRIYGIVKLMLSKAENLDSISDKKKLSNEKSEIIKLHKLLAKELK